MPKPEKNSGGLIGWKVAVDRPDAWFSRSSVFIPQTTTLTLQVTFLERFLFHRSLSQQKTAQHFAKRYSHSLYSSNASCWILVVCLCQKFRRTAILLSL